jgi:hypothetical protein
VCGGRADLKLLERPRTGRMRGVHLCWERGSGKKIIRMRGQRAAHGAPRHVRLQQLCVLCDSSKCRLPS